MYLIQPLFDICLGSMEKAIDKMPSANVLLMYTRAGDRDCFPKFKKLYIHRLFKIWDEKIADFTQFKELEDIDVNLLGKY